MSYDSSSYKYRVHFLNWQCDQAECDRLGTEKRVPVWSGIHHDDDDDDVAAMRWPAHGVTVGKQLERFRQLGDFLRTG